MHFMASSRGIVIVLPINVCAASITGDLVLSVSLMWLASLLGVPRVVVALTTCRVTLLEPPPPPLISGSLGLHVPLHPGGQGYGHHLQWDSQVLWGCELSCLSHGLGSATLPLLFPWLHFLHVKNPLTFRCTTVCISGVPMCWVEKKKNKLYL